MSENAVLPIHFVSYSSLNLLHSCPRKFELAKLGGEKPGFKTLHFTFGSAVGAGIQELFLSGGDLGKAYLAAFNAWDMDLFEGLDPEKPLKNHAKSFPYVIEAIKRFEPEYNVLRGEWEVYTYEVEGNQRAAVELSARVEFPDSFVYRIYIDVVLRNKVTGMLVVLELKTDGMKYVAEEKYGNSNQALSYSVILDKIAQGITSFDVWYFVYYTSLEKWEFFSFTKSRLQKANWIRTVLYDTGNIKRCLGSGFFPKQGESCLEFGSACEYYGSCDMSNNALHAGPHTIRARVAKELKEEYDFNFTLQEIIDKQLSTISDI